MWKKLWKRLRCKHRNIEKIKTIRKQDDGIWRSVSAWRCKDCGKIL